MKFILISLTIALMLGMTSAGYLQGGWSGPSYRRVVYSPSYGGWPSYGRSSYGSYRGYGDYGGYGGYNNRDDGGWNGWSSGWW